MPSGVVQVVSGPGAMVFVDGRFAGLTTEAQGGLVVLGSASGSSSWPSCVRGALVVRSIRTSAER